MPDEAEAARMALEAGTDVEMVSTTYHDTLPAQVSAGRVSEATIDESVRRVLGVKFRLGLFERLFTDAGLFRSAILRPDAIALAREAAARSYVLLKNENLLPIADLLFGDLAPSGRLTISFPIEVGQLPVYYNRYNTGRPTVEMVNYRDLTLEAPFPFGFANR